MLQKKVLLLRKCHYNKSKVPAPLMFLVYRMADGTVHTYIELTSYTNPVYDAFVSHQFYNYFT